MLVHEEEAPQEEDGSTMVEDEGSFCSDAGVSSTAVSPKLILIPAPVRASMHTQRTFKGCGTTDHPYDLDITPTMCRGRGVSPETHRQHRDCRSVSIQLSLCYSPGVGFASCQARNVKGQYHQVCEHVGSSRSGSDSNCPSDELASGVVAHTCGWCAGSYTDRGGRS